jgi:murein DD-endopeptidase MepM/ murein hydrolase activator NlpD
MFQDRTQLVQLALFLTLSITAYEQVPAMAERASWSPPLIGSKLLNNYRQPETPYGKGHRGVDYSVRLGQAVFAPDDGRVHFVGEVVNRPLISLNHGGNLLSAFEPVCSTLLVGQRVSRGALIGEVCEGNETYQAHCQSRCLHFSARLNGEYLSPLWLTGELQGSRLLPLHD